MFTSHPLPLAFPVPHGPSIHQHFGLQCLEASNLEDDPIIFAQFADIFVLKVTKARALECWANFSPQHIYKPSQILLPVSLWTRDKLSHSDILSLDKNLD
jgi:hypothetical protein